MRGGLWIRFLGLAVAIGAGAGLASGLFLEALRLATEAHNEHPWLLYLLPLAGALIAALYAGYGRTAAGGNNLLLDEIHRPQTSGVPLLMFPLILGTTVITHLFGGSAGREGTAVQMGGSIAGEVARRFRLDQAQTRMALMCGISGGFSGVFGTPLAGTVFGMEMLAVGAIRYEALIPCLMAALVADETVRLLDVAHSHYAIDSVIPALSPEIIAKVALVGIGCGIVSATFSELTALIEHHSRRLFANPIARTTIGGVLVVGLTLALGTRIYNGLSLPLLSDSFTGDVPMFAFAAKLLLTALTLGVGFKGGEVTPLFVIGATFGATLSGPLGLAPDFAAGLGFIAVFAAAANTPIACVLMGAELFGAGGIVYFGIATFVAYTISGHRGIYHAQRIAVPKHVERHAHPAAGMTIRDLREQRRQRTTPERQREPASVAEPAGDGRAAQATPAIPAPEGSSPQN